MRKRGRTAREDLERQLAFRFAIRKFNNFR
jgi:hypothetical protein